MIESRWAAWTRSSSHLGSLFLFGVCDLASEVSKRAADERAVSSSGFFDSCSGAELSGDGEWWWMKLMYACTCLIHQEEAIGISDALFYTFQALGAFPFISVLFLQP